MTLTGRQPPCAFPPHPGEEDPGGPPGVTVRPRPSLARWVRHAPAERAPAVAIPLMWPAAEIMHAAGLPGLYPGGGTVLAAALAGWAAERRAAASEHPAMTAAEVAAAAAAAGGWVTAADIFGPLAGHPPWLTLAYLAGSAGGYCVAAHPPRGPRRPRPPRPGRRRRRRLAGEEGMVALGRAPDRPRPVPPAGSDADQPRRGTARSPPPRTGDLASRIAANSGAIAERLAHLLGLPVRPGRHRPPPTFRASCSSASAPWTCRPAESRLPPDDRPVARGGAVPVRRLVPRDRHHPRTLSIWGFCPEDGSPLSMELFSDDRRPGRRRDRHDRLRQVQPAQQRSARTITRCDDARLVQFNGAHMGDELTWEPLSALTLCGPVATDEELSRQDRRGARPRCACWSPTGRRPSPRPGTPRSSPPRRTRLSASSSTRSTRSSSTCPARGRCWNSWPPSSASPRCSWSWSPSGPSSTALGGGAVRANMSEVLVGKVVRATRVPARHRRRNGKSPTSATTPRAPPATSSGGTRGPGPSPAGAGRSCSASPPRNSRT